VGRKEVKTFKEFWLRLQELDHETVDTIGDDIVPPKHIIEIAFKEFQLDAFKAGMTRATEIVKAYWSRLNSEDSKIWGKDALPIAKDKILTDRNNLKEIP
jgi:hydroxymethylpyrimidine/phosphomethylpyrimidine kinase